MQEEWRPVVGWPEYLVSNLGRVKSLPRIVERFNPRWNCPSPMRRRERFLKPKKHQTKNYFGDLKGQRRPVDALIIGLQVGDRRGQYYLHRLVLEAFVGPCPEGLEGCHFDGDPFNNRLDNLRWDTSAANKADSMRHGTFFPGRFKGNYTKPKQEYL